MWDRISKVEIYCLSISKSKAAYQTNMHQLIAAADELVKDNVLVWEFLVTGVWKAYSSTMRDALEYRCHCYEQRDDKVSFRKSHGVDVMLAGDSVSFKSNHSLLTMEDSFQIDCVTGEKISVRCRHAFNMEGFGELMANFESLKL